MKDKEDQPIVFQYRSHRRPAIPWWSLLSMGYVVFWVLYQLSPEFQAWVNYTWRYWSRYPSYGIRYSYWWLKQNPEASDGR